MSEVEYRAIHKAFDDVVAVEALDMYVPDGAFVALLGPSGCGKTTALRIVAGLEAPTSGSVHLGGRDVTGLSPRDRDVAMVFQSYALYPQMTVAENIAYPLRVRRVARAERMGAVRGVAEALDVDHLLDRHPRQLSGGQRQRIALARAIVREPVCFLLDEPLSNLDAKLRTTMRGEIKRLQKRLETTTLYVTHDQVEAVTMADLIAVMHDGHLQQLGTADEIYNRPANRFVATFVGSPPMNILPGRLDVDRATFVVGKHSIALDEATVTACAAAEAIELGVRPEDLSLCEPDAAAMLGGEIYLVEPMGNETLVDVLVAGTRITVRAARDFRAQIGSNVGIDLEARAACFFDRDGAAAVERSDRRAKTAVGAASAPTHTYKEGD